MAAMIQDAAAIYGRRVLNGMASLKQLQYVPIKIARWTDSSDHSRLYDVTLRVINGEQMAR